MAGELKIKSGTKLRLAMDVGIGEEPRFNMVCTFAKSLDESAFLISIPMRDGKPMPLDETQKLLIRYGAAGSDDMIVAGYADDIVKEGIRRYWKIRRVSEQRQFFQRADERLKVALPILYRQETWQPNDDGASGPPAGVRGFNIIRSAGRAQRLFARRPGKSHGSGFFRTRRQSGGLAF